MQAVIVTGGSRGLGFEIARTLTAAGYRVIAIARQESEQLSSAIQEAKPDQRGSLEFRRFDLNDLANIPELVRQIRRDVGPIYGLVNNAALGNAGVLATMRDTQIEQLVRVNVSSPLILTKYVARSMMTEGRGRVVNISSIVSFTGYSGLSVYGATKASLVGFTRSLARELGPLGVNVNAVAPGFLDTNMTEGLEEQQRDQIARRSALRRLAKVGDVAHAVEFFLDEKSRNVTGTVLTVDAGSTA